MTSGNAVAIAATGVAPQVTATGVACADALAAPGNGMSEKGNNGEQGDTASAHGPPPRVNERGAGDGR